MAIVEIADGLLQPETAAVLRSPLFQSVIDAALFAASDALAAMAGVEICRQHNLRVLGLSGLLTAAPLQQREACAATGLPAFGLEELVDPITAAKLADEARG